MFKKSIRFPFIHFVVSVIWQFIFNKEVRWFDSIGISIIIFLIFLLYYWSKKPYEWKKSNND